MKYLIKTLADNHKVNPIHLTRFAAINAKRYGVLLEDGQYNISTFSVNDLIRDFNVAVGDYNSKAIRVKYTSNYLQPIDLQGLTVDGWSINKEEHSGSIAWSNDKYPQYRVYATPNWDIDGITPFEVHCDTDEYGGTAIIAIKQYDGSPIEFQKNMYISVLKTIIAQIESKTL